MKKLPEHIRKDFGGTHGFRKTKRREVREALRAAEAARNGCAYTPAYLDIIAAIGRLEDAVEALSVKRWGR